MYTDVLIIWQQNFSFKFLNIFLFTSEFLIPEIVSEISDVNIGQKKTDNKFLTDKEISD